MLLERGALLNNRYRIIEILGQGGMGSVYRSIDENLGVEVAVKDNLFTTEEYARQFRREAVILANLRHPNLPRVTDHFVIHGQGQYLVMDYIEGEDLRQRMERIGVIPEEEVITIGAAVCDALSYLASRKPKIIHRDIKPGNVRITPQGQIFLVDFGLAKTLHGSQATTTGARAMTPGFSPPEQYGTARTDQRSDIFSLGATLYAALTGAVPEDALARAMDQAELTSIRKHNPRISRKLITAIEKALEVRPDDRYQEAEDFKQALLTSSTSTKRKEGEYIVPPPPGEERPIPEDEVAMEPELDGISPAMADRQPQLMPISTPLDDLDRRKSRSKPRSRGRKRVLWTGLAFVIILAGLSAAIYLVDPGLPSRAVARLFPGLSMMTNTPTLSSLVQDTPEITFTLAQTRTIAEGNLVATSTFLPTPTFTIMPSDTPTPTTTPTVIPTPFGGGLGCLAFASDMTGLPQIYIINVDGTGLFQVTNLEEGACQPSWSPDAQRLVFTSPCNTNRENYPGSSLYVINKDGSGIQPLPTLTGGDFDPAWSPTENRIAFTSLRTGGRYQVYLINLDDNTVELLSEQSSNDVQPSWSPDGELLSFTSNTSGTPQIWILDINSRERKQFSRTKGWMNYHATWSPDMKTIVFTQFANLGGIPQIAIASFNFDEYTEYRIGTPPMREAVFSPDGYWLAYEGWTPGEDHNIYLVAVGGSVKQQLTSEPETEFDAAWCPDTRP